jgi:signal transduction histidine kinase
MAERGHPDVTLVMAPIGADADNIRSVLERTGLTAAVCRTITDFRAVAAGEIGAMVLTEEALTPELQAELQRTFLAQPPWSDVPVVLIASAGPHPVGPILAARLRGPRRTVTLLERPLRSVTLLATLETLRAARERQYEIRDLLHERDALLSSLETRVAERTAELRGLVEEMEAFSYSVSHDLRAPLRSLAGYAEALRDDFGAQLPPEAQVYCEKIIRAARRMDSLTQDVLAYTRVARGDMEITSVDLDTLLDEVIDQYPALGASAARIRIARPLGCVRGHVPSLIQCFSNLLGNAVKFVPRDRTPIIDIRAQRDGGRRRVFVQDNGVGISPADQVRIFQMFERAADKSIPGTGIGLAIVRRAVERMGGTAGVTSTAGQGAEFWIELADGPPPCTTTITPADLATFWSDRPPVAEGAERAP